MGFWPLVNLKQVSQEKRGESCQADSIRVKTACVFGEFFDHLPSYVELSSPHLSARSDLISK